MNGINSIVEGTEYKLFEDLYVNKESIIFIPQHIEFENSFKMNIQNWLISWNLSAYFVSRIHFWIKFITKCI